MNSKIMLQSTRGGGLQSVESGLVTGYAPDGGLLVPSEPINLPWSHWKNHTYPQIVAEIVKYFVNDSDIAKLVTDTYSSGCFDCPDALQSFVLSEGGSVLEMFHGPTWSFKDYAMTPLVTIIQHLMEQRKESITLLVATSGDTGGAALEAVKGCPNVKLVLLMPHNRVSRIQYLQMSTSKEDNVNVLNVDATSDELDDVLKPIFKDPIINQQVKLSSVNSICWGRIMIQMAHYFHAYLKSCTKIGDPVTIVVPTGAAGNLASGLLAQSCGLPIKLVACTNENDIVHRFISTGVFEIKETKKTLANAMDIQVPYNIERMVYIISEGDCSFVTNFMHSFYKTGKSQLPTALLKKLQNCVTSAVITDTQILETIKWMQSDYNYSVCPHTATSLAWWRNSHPRSKNEPVVCIATASPEKFSEVLLQAGIKNEPSEKLKALEKLGENVPQVQFLDQSSRANWSEQVAQSIRSLNRIK